MIYSVSKRMTARNSRARQRERNLLLIFLQISTLKKQDVPVDCTNCIENFLGQDIINNPVVQNSRITVQERNELESPLTLQELDESLADCNMRSAAGADGFSNKLIKACWQVLRIPLYNYALHCYNTGILTTNFRSACFKLIPKKGDVSKLKNWRPITLLSNMYKIISRAINNQLK
jgi:hypothetical protein